MRLHHRIIAAAALSILTMGPAGGSTAETPLIEHLTGVVPKHRAPDPALPEPDRTIVEPPAPGEGPLQTSGGILVFADTADQEEMVLEALGRFAEFGLELPPGLEIHFHEELDGCSGNRGLATHGTDLERIDMCRTHLFTLMHEITHVWAHHTLTDSDRLAFLEERGLESWRDGVPWEERGTEHAAHVVAWGLGDRPIHLTEIPDTAFDRLAAAFELLTGSPPRFLQDRDSPAAGSSASAAGDRAAPSTVLIREQPR